MTERDKYFQAYRVLKDLLLGEQPDGSNLPVRRIEEATALVVAYAPDPGAITEQSAREVLRQLAGDGSVPREVQDLANSMADYQAPPERPAPHEVTATLGIDGMPNKNRYYDLILKGLPRKQLEIYTSLAPQS